MPTSIKKTLLETIGIVTEVPGFRMTSDPPVDGGARDPHFATQAHKIRKFIASSPVKDVLGEVADVFNRSVAIYLVGGALRDCIVEPPVAYRDLDVLVDSPVAVGECLAAGQDLGWEFVRVNGFGGHRFRVRGQRVDVWNLRSSYHVTHLGGEPTLLSHFSYTPFDVQRIAVDLYSGWVWDAGCVEAVRERTIEYGPAKPYADLYQQHWCRKFQERGGFALGLRAREFVDRFDDPDRPQARETD